MLASAKRDTMPMCLCKRLGNLMQQDVLICQIERDIDQTFAASGLPAIGYAQAMWTLLSVNEDAFLKALRDTSSGHDMHIFMDVRLNALSYPLRVCLERAEKKKMAYATL